MKSILTKLTGVSPGVIGMVLFLSGACFQSAVAQSGPTYMVNYAVVTNTSVTFSAMVNPDGVAGPRSNRANVLVSWRFGLTTGYTGGTTTAKTIGMGTSAEEVSATIANNRLRASDYHFQLVVTSSLGILYGPDQVVSLNLPAVVIGTPVESASGSVVYATVNPNMNDTQVYFQYGPTTAYSSGNTASVDIGSGTMGVPVSGTLSGLAPNTLYYYRVVAMSAVGTIYGTAQRLATLPLYGTAVLVSTKTAAPGIPNGIFLGFGNPAINDMDHTAFQAAVTGAGITASNNSGIWADVGTNGLTLIARTGLTAPGYGGLGTIGTFAKLSDPVYANDDNLAFIGTLVGAPVVTGIWATASGTLGLVAKAGDFAPDETGITSLTSPKFASFVQFVLPDQGGVVFLATLAATKNVTGVNNLGLWAVDTSGALKQVVRTGNGISVNGVGKGITGLTIFSAPATATGQTCDFNSAGDLLYKILLNDKSTSIVQTLFP